jgi:hypothetical protein
MAAYLLVMLVRDFAGTAQPIKGDQPVNLLANAYFGSISKDL